MRQVNKVYSMPEQQVTVNKSEGNSPSVFAALCSRRILLMLRLVGVDWPDSVSSPWLFRWAPEATGAVFAGCMSIEVGFCGWAGCFSCTERLICEFFSSIDCEFGSAAPDIDAVMDELLRLVKLVSSLPAFSSWAVVVCCCWAPLLDVVAGPEVAVVVVDVDSVVTVVVVLVLLSRAPLWPTVAPFVISGIEFFGSTDAGGTATSSSLLFRFTCWLLLLLAFGWLGVVAAGSAGCCTGSVVCRLFAAGCRLAAGFVCFFLLRWWCCGMIIWLLYSIFSWRFASRKIR